MRVEVNVDTLASIRNPALRTYAGQYVWIVQDFMEQVRQSGIEIDSGGEARCSVSSKSPDTSTMN